MDLLKALCATGAEDACQRMVTIRVATALYYTIIVTCAVITLSLVVTWLRKRAR